MDKGTPKPQKKYLSQFQKGLTTVQELDLLVKARQENEVCKSKSDPEYDDYSSNPGDLMSGSETEEEEGIT